MKIITMKISLIAALIILSVYGVSAADAKKDKGIAGSRKILVVYFSHTGNTREVAKQISGLSGADIFEIVPEKLYPEDYEATKRIAKRELNSGYRAPLKSKIGNLSSYDVVFVGYPVWWGSFPAPVRTFLTENSFKGKSIVPFCTHLGSGLGRSVQDVISSCPGSTVLEGIAVLGNETKSSQGKISAWLKKINIIK